MSMNKAVDEPFVEIKKTAIDDYIKNWPTE